MKKHLNYWLALVLLLPALHACQDDNTMPGEEPGEAGQTTVIRASIGDEPDTRAQVKWGTQDAAEGEYFMWNAGDQFKAYNITAAETTPTAYTFEISNTYDEANPGNQADFSCTNFSAAAGNKIAAFYGSIYGSVASVTNATHGKGIQAVLERPSIIQSQTATPGNADLKNLQGQLCMYAIGQADGSGSVSPLSFRHLSALFRITIRNQKSDEAKIDYTEIRFPESEKIICTKKTVTVWEDNTVEHEVAENDKRYYAGNYLDNANGDGFATIAPGSSYDCFIAALPVAKEGNTASSITIMVRFSDNTQKSVTIDGFSGVAIEAGMRYWFDLTVKADGTLVQTRTLTDAYAWYASNKDATEYTLSNAKQLRALARLVNGDPEALAAAGVSGAVNFAGKTVRIADDVTELDLASEAWEPIGTSNITTRETTPFKGTFDGNNKEIKNILINRPADNYQGLFGVIDGATIQNVKIASGSITGDGNVGGIAGVAQNGSRIIACENRAEVNGKAFAIGGIAGYKSSTDVIACQNYGPVSGGTDGQKVGGIVGTSNSGDIIACINHGGISGLDLKGGIIGSNGFSGLIGACLNEGEVAVSSGTKGGIAGIMSTFTVDTYAENYFYGTGEYPKAVGKVGNDQYGVGDAGIPYADINSKVDALNGVISTWNAAHPGKECAYRYAASLTPDSALPTLTKQTP